MALQTSGAISLNDIHIEAGGSSGSQASINDTDIRGLIGKGSGAQMSFSEWYGAAAETVLTSAGTINGQAQQKEITVSSFISSGETFRIPSNLWVWSDNRNTPALTIDIPCTVINEGKIIGKGGGYTSPSVTNGRQGGPAIKITSSGVTIQNASGAYIAGGGGSGSGGGYVGYGGGAGGGNGGTSNGTFNDQGGGALNATGGDFDASSSIINSNAHGHGGGAGGGGGGIDYLSQFGSSAPGGGGGGGRILPGSGGAKGTAVRGNGGDGGSGGSAGGTATKQSGQMGPGGGGGGWGASGGGDTGGATGYSGGSAIDDSGNSYSFSNSGTVYGGT